MKIVGGRMPVSNALVPAERIERVILMIRARR